MIWIQGYCPCALLKYHSHRYSHYFLYYFSERNIFPWAIVYGLSTNPYFCQMASLEFQIKATEPGSKARAGKITTDHGEIATPIFMPVGTVDL